MDRFQALDLAAELCGGITKLAAAIGVGQTVASNWKARGTLIDAKACRAIERVTAGRVMRWHLRPDDWWEIWDDLIDMKGAPSVPLLLGKGA